MAQYNDPESFSEDQLLQDIETVGWSVILIEATDYLPSFAYTVGLWKNYQHPELIAFGLSISTLHSILNTGGELVKEGQTLKTGIAYDDFFEGSPAQLIEVHPGSIKDYFGYATWFNENRDYPALQLVWSDGEQRFPWDTGFNEDFIYQQPLLDRNAGFKFREARNLGVFTTRQWLEENKPILQVVHDEEGDWLFLTGEQEQEDMRVVAIEQLVLRDPTLNDVFNLDYGAAAERDGMGEEWTR